MNKFLFLLILLAGAGIFWASGYRVYPQHVPYYFKPEVGGPMREILLKNGTTLKGSLVEETNDSLKLNIEGATMSFTESEIESIKASKADGFLAAFIRNYEIHHKIHPLVAKQKGASLHKAWDEFVMEPSRIAEDIKKEHPHLSSSGMLDRAMGQYNQSKILQNRQPIDGANPSEAEMMGGVDGQ